MSFFAELRRRNVFRVAIAYVVVAWLVLQVADVVLNNIEAPGWVFQTIMLVLLIGFPVILVIAWAFEMTPEGLKREHEVDRSQSIASQTGRKLDRLIIGIMAAVIVFLLLDRFVFEDTPDESANEPVATSDVSEAEPDGTPQPSVAVLPFVNMSGDPENEYFSDGLTENLLHMLAQLPELKVAARTSSFSFKGKNASIDEIATALGVDNILEGSVQKSGDRVRVTAQLIRADDGFHVWSQNYTRPLEDIFAIQDEIANDVANALDVELLGGDSEAIHGVATSSVSAYDTYLKAMEQQSIFSYGSLEAAEGLFKQALAIDPGFIDAKLGLARNYLMMHGTGLLDEEETRARLEPLLQQVRAEQPDDPLARALELLMDLQTPTLMDIDTRMGILDELRTLLAEIPTETYVRGWVAGQLEFFGNQSQAALEVLQAGLIVDPLSAYLHARLGNLYLETERFDEASESFHRALEIDPRDPGTYHRLARLATEQNDMVGALNWLRRSTEVDPQDHELAANIAYSLYSLNLPEEGDRWARRVAALAPGSDIVRALAVASAYASGNWSRVMDLAGEMITDQASFRHGSFLTAVFDFGEAASLAGKPRQGYEFLVRARPEVADFDSEPPDPHVLVMRWVALTLMSEFADPEFTRAAWAAHIEHQDATGFPWHEDGGQVIDHFMRGELDSAIRVALEEDLQEPLATWPRRADAYRVPTFAAIANDPEVAARLAELDREKEHMRKEVRDLLQQPEWNP